MKKTQTSEPKSASFPLVRCSALPMFEGHPLIVTGQLEAEQVEVMLLHRNGAFVMSTHNHFCVPKASIYETGEFATLIDTQHEHPSLS